MYFCHVRIITNKQHRFIKKTNMKLTLMKTAAAVLLLAATTQNAVAQRWRDAPRFHLGVRAGVSTTVPLESWDGSDSGELTAPMAGVAFDTRVATIPFYIETGIYYMNRGCQTSGRVYYGNTAHSYTYTENNHSLLIPALISYHAYVADKVSLQPFMGPYVTLSMNSNETGDYGWRFGCGINVKQIYANVGFDLGLKNNFYFHEGNVSSLFVNVGWNFIGKK